MQEGRRVSTTAHSCLVSHRMAPVTPTPKVEDALPSLPKADHHSSSLEAPSAGNMPAPVKISPMPSMQVEKGTQIPPAGTALGDQRNSDELQEQTSRFDPVGAEDLSLLASHCKPSCSNDCLGVTFSELNVEWHTRSTASTGYITQISFCRRPWGLP